MRNASFLVAAVQAIAAIFLIMNMVQIAAFSRRHEISIMRMVGASRWYTQMPFVLEAVIGAIIGAVLAVGGMYAGKNWWLTTLCVLFMTPTWLHVSPIAIFGWRHLS